MKPGLIIAIAISGALAAGWNSSPLWQELSGGTSRASLDAHESHAAVSLLGQVRTNVSSWLWLKADLYLHNGVEMRPLTDDEKRQGKQVQSAAGDGHEQVIQEANVTVVPSKNEDFRGWVGDVERATAAYKDMSHHTHNDPIAALPLFRLMTWVDPQFVPAWTTGATIISRRVDTQGTSQALAFLKSGLEANPDSVEMLTEIGYLHATRRKDLRTAAEFLERARLKGRLARSLDEEERQALQECYRWLALCYRDLGETEELGRVVAEGLGSFPDDSMLPHLAPNMPLVLSPNATRAWAAGKTKR